MQPYVFKNGKAALNDLFWQNVDKGTQAASASGIAVMVDLLDRWGLQGDKCGQSSPMASNRGGFLNPKSCLPDVYSHPETLAMITLGVKELAKHDNIVYQIANEPSGYVSHAQITAFHNSVKDIIKRNHPQALIGTNPINNDPRAFPVYDFVTIHGAGIDNLNDRKSCGVVALKASLAKLKAYFKAPLIADTDGLWSEKLPCNRLDMSVVKDIAEASIVVDGLNHKDLEPPEGVNVKALEIVGGKTVEGLKPILELHFQTSDTLEKVWMAEGYWSKSDIKSRKLYVGNYSKILYEVPLTLRGSPKFYRSETNKTHTAYINNAELYLLNNATGKSLKISNSIAVEQFALSDTKLLYFGIAAEGAKSYYIKSLETPISINVSLTTHGFNTACEVGSEFFLAKRLLSSVILQRRDINTFVLLSEKKYDPLNPNSYETPMMSCQGLAMVSSRFDKNINDHNGKVYIFANDKVTEIGEQFDVGLVNQFPAIMVDKNNDTYIAAVKNGMTSVYKNGVIYKSGVAGVMPFLFKNYLSTTSGIYKL